MATQKPNQAVLDARKRRTSSAPAREAEVKWFIDDLQNKVNLTFTQRVRLATEFLRSKVVKNISRPVTKLAGGRVVDRSKSGEFPKAETTLLSKTIFGDVIQQSIQVVDGVVGTPLSYGLILEVSMNRSFLVRTMNEEMDNITKILSGPII